MTSDLQRQLARFKRVPQIEDVWEGAVLPLPTWIEPDGCEPYRPTGAVWVSTTGRAANFVMAEADTAAGDEDLALSALAEMGTSAKRAGFRPRTLRVRNERLAGRLRTALDDASIRIEVAPDLPAVDAFIEDMADGVNGGEHVPSALEAPGVTPERLAAFADAAKRFYEAAPWQHLGEYDLIAIESPKAGAGLSLLAVMGGAGETFGLGFFSSLRRYHAMMDGTPPETLMKEGSDWAVYLSPPWETAFGDLDAWERYGLPLASDRAYPTAIRLDVNRRPQRPDAGRLAYLEGLLRVLAETHEEEMDTGRWSRTVPTAEGEQTYVLTLPDLLAPRDERQPMPDRRAMERFAAEVGRVFGEQQFDGIDDLNAAIAERFAGVTLDDLPSTASTPLERAQDLIYQAFEARGRRQLQLIRQALEISPDCADAYVLLAERAATAAAARPLYDQAVAAAERALGPEAFSDPERSWWGDVETRPYMRARAGLADCLLELGDGGAAADHFRALLRLNPGDNQGLRYSLLTALLHAGLNAEAESLLGEHVDDESPAFRYAAVLLALRRQDQSAARRLLRAAVKANRRVPDYLVGRRELPAELPTHYALGSDDEAVLCADDLIVPWSETPGAVAWLRKEMARSKRK
jgi:hypothetical protein